MAGLLTGKRVKTMDDLLGKVIYSIERCICHVPDACRDCAYDVGHPYNECVEVMLKDAITLLKAKEADESKYEYHIDHTNCPWYISGEESRCPVTCSQYRDGWNDAMNYIFRNGDGYRPYERIRKGR